MQGGSQAKAKHHRRAPKPHGRKPTRAKPSNQTVGFFFCPFQSFFCPVTTFLSLPSCSQACLDLIFTMSSSAKISKISSACLPRHNTAGTSEKPPSEKLPTVKNSFHYLSHWFLMWRGSWFFDVEGRRERGQGRQEEQDK